jgi:hypothetical protein
VPDFSLLALPNFAQSALAGYQAGRQMHQQNEREGALQGYLANPEDSVALTRLTAADPELGFPLMKDRRAEAQRQQIGQLAAAAAAGDHQAALKLYELDPDLANRFDTQHTKKIDEGKAALGNAALHVALLPEAARPAAWAQAVDALTPNYPDLKHYRDEYSPQNLDGVIDYTGVRQKLIELQQPKYQVGPPGGELRQTNPFAGEIDMSPIGGGDAGPVQIHDDAGYAALPPGASYIDPHGNHRVKGGAGPSGPQTFR